MRVGLALWCLVWAGAAFAGTAQVVQVDRSEVVLNAGRRDGLVLDTQVSLLRAGSPIVHPLTGQVLGRPQEPVGLARVFEVGEHQARAVVEKAYSAAQVGDAAEFAAAGAGAPAEGPGHAVAEEPAARPEAHAAADGHGADKAASPREPQGRGQGDPEMQQRLKDLERSVEEYHSSSKTLKAYPVFAQRVWDEISTMKSYLVSLDERLAQLEEQNQERHHLGGESGGGEGMREFTIRYAPDTQVKVKVAGKTLLVSVDHDSLHVEEEGAVPAAAEAGESHGEAVAVHGGEAHGSGGEELAEPAHGGEAPVVEEEHGGEPHGEAAGHEGEMPWYQSPWVLGIGVLTLGLVAGVVSWMIKRRYEEESEELEAEYLADEDEDEDEEEDDD